MSKTKSNQHTMNQHIALSRLVSLTKALLRLSTTKTFRAEAPNAERQLQTLLCNTRHFAYFQEIAIYDYEFSTEDLLPCFALLKECVIAVREACIEPGSGSTDTLPELMLTIEDAHYAFRADPCNQMVFNGIDKDSLIGNDVLLKKLEYIKDIIGKETITIDDQNISLYEAVKYCLHRKP